MKTVLTDLGINAAIAAGIRGPLIKVTKVRIGSAIITPTSDMTDVTSFVWEGDSSYIQYQIPEDRTFLFKIVLDESIGNFDIGNIGLFLEDGTMFTITNLDKVENKIKNDNDGVVGNRRIFEIPLVLSGISSLIDLTLLVPDESSIPFVQTENNLPSYITAPYSVYSVLNNTVTKTPCLALRTQNSWSYLFPTPASASTSFSTTLFDANVNVGDLVYWNSLTQTFSLADGLDNSKGFIGVRGELNNVISSGVITNSNWSLVQGNHYYADGDLNAGNLTTLANNWYVGKAIDTHILYIGIEKETVLAKSSSINVLNPSSFKYLTELAIFNYSLDKDLNELSQIGEEKIAALIPSGAPVGSWIGYAGFENSIPGYLEMDGSAVSRTTYAELFNVIGTNYGDGNGTTTFNLPNAYAYTILQGSRTPAQIILDGLPNITGTGARFNHELWTPTNQSNHNDGAIFKGEAYGECVLTGTNDNTAGSTYGWSFNAAGSNPIYGRSSKVQPSALTTRYFIKYK